MRLLEQALTFDDILLVPARSSILPKEVSLATQLTQNISINIPLLSAAMDTVTESELAIAMAEEGGIEQNGNFDIDMWDEGYPGLDPTDYLLWTYYYSEAAEPDVGYNISRWMNEDFDALLDEAYTLDEEYRKELFCEMAEILIEEAPQILLWSAFDASAHSSRLKGVQASINDTHTWNIADWTVDEG